MRVFDYIIVCKSPDFKNVDRISQFMLFISVISFSYSIYLGLFPKPALIFAIMTSSISWWIFAFFNVKEAACPTTDWDCYLHPGGGFTNQWLNYSWHILNCSPF